MLISTLNRVIKQQTYCQENELNKTLLSTKVLKWFSVVDTGLVWSIVMTIIWMMVLVI